MFCIVDIDDCATVVCDNSGRCVDALNAYTCACTPGFTGQHCENGSEFNYVSNALWTDVTHTQNVVCISKNKFDWMCDCVRFKMSSNIWWLVWLNTHFIIWCNLLKGKPYKLMPIGGYAAICLHLHKLLLCQVSRCFTRRYQRVCGLLEWWLWGFVPEHYRVLQMFL